MLLANVRRLFLALRVHRDLAFFPSLFLEGFAPLDLAFKPTGGELACLAVTYKAFDVYLHCPATLKVIGEQ